LSFPRFREGVGASLLIKDGPSTSPPVSGCGVGQDDRGGLVGEVTSAVAVALCEGQ
jgi:hypothetical protein